MKKTQAYILGILMILSFTACDKEDDINEYEVIKVESAIQKGERVLGINISEGEQGFMYSFDKAVEAGIDAVEINIPWNAIETSQGVYEDPWNGVIAATGFYGDNSIRVSFSIALINTVQWEIPGYLENTSPSSAEFISAFNQMIDWFIKSVPGNVIISGISIGNEVDFVLNGSSDWNSYKAFYEAAASHIRENHPDIRTGVKCTVTGGLFAGNKQNIIDLNENSDVVMLNYYPQDDKFRVKDPETVLTDFDEIVSLFPGKEIWMTEVGYQSGNNKCNSSYEKQALFMHYLFKAWDVYHEEISHIVINWICDQSPGQIKIWEDYYGDDPALVEYLSTLGLLEYDGTEKPACKQLKEETTAR